MEAIPVRHAVVARVAILRRLRARCTDALVKLVALKEPQARFAAGADAVQTFETKANTLLAHARARGELSSSLAY